MPIPITEKLIQRQINHWHEFRKYLATETKPPARARPLSIAVSREVGSGGRQIATLLAERLGLPLHDRSLVTRVMRRENLPPALAAELDEQVTSQTNLWIKGLFNRRIFLIKEYEHALARTIKRLAETAGGVFLGRGAHLVLADSADLRLRVLAGADTRRRRLQERHDLDPTEARTRRDEIDYARAQFLAKVFGASQSRAHDFDLTVNTDRLAAADAVELVLVALVARAGRGAAAAAAAPAVTI